MLFAFLYQAVFAEVDNVLTDRQAESTKKAVRDGLNTVMESSTQFHPPFIGSLQVMMCTVTWQHFSCIVSCSFLCVDVLKVSIYFC